MANNCIKLLLAISCALLYHDGSFVSGLPVDSQSVPASDPTDKAAMLTPQKTDADSKTPDETASSHEHTTAETDTGHWHIHDHTVYNSNPEVTPQKTDADSKTPDETGSSHEHTTAQTGHWHIHDHTVYNHKTEANTSEKPPTEGCNTFTVTMTIPPPIQAIPTIRKNPPKEKNLTDNEIPTGFGSVDASEFI